MEPMPQDHLLEWSSKAAKAAAAHAGIPALRPSAHWQEVLRKFHFKAFTQCRTPQELISFSTENNGFVIYRLLDSPFIGQVLDRYLGWLDRNGYPLEKFAPEIAESPLASERVVCERRGRRVSTSFLWHLCAATRLRSAQLDQGTVLEIGPGFGGLTRIMKLLSPAQSFLLVDLPETLVFTYVYLCKHFPEARILFMADHQPLPVDWAKEFDFVLVPSNLLDNLRDHTVDLALNLASFGEMTAEATRAFVRFLEMDMQVTHLYSINQYGRFPAAVAKDHGGRLIREDICRVALPVDAFWRTLQWHFLEIDGFAQADPLMAPCLEVLLRRLPPEQQDTLENKKLSCRLAAEAEAQRQGSASWHSLLWDSARLNPEGQAAVLLAEWGSRMEYPEFTGS